jgi:hypothetical protein
MKRIAKAFGLCIAASLTVMCFGAAQAPAYYEYYGQYNICGSGCYVQSSGAHTFYYNSGQSELTSTRLACQLRNDSGVNNVSHGFGNCSVTYSGGQYVWARVYNQSGGTDFVGGFATTP